MLEEEKYHYRLLASHHAHASPKQNQLRLFAVVMLFLLQQTERCLSDSKALIDLLALVWAVCGALENERKPEKAAGRTTSCRSLSRPAYKKTTTTSASESQVTKIHVYALFF